MLRPNGRYALPARAGGPMVLLYKYPTNTGEGPVHPTCILTYRPADRHFGRAGIPHAQLSIGKVVLSLCSL